MATSPTSPKKTVEPPLVEVKVTNPITYIKAWWKKVIKNEGVDFEFHIRPLTAIAIAIVIATIGFGVGRFVLPEGIDIPFFEYSDSTTSPTPTTENIWKETAYTGTLRHSSETGKYYLVTTSSEAITLEVPENMDLRDFIGKRIFVTGKYNKSSRILVIADAKDTEVLSKTPVSLPTYFPTPTPSASPTSAPIQTSTPVPTETS